MTSIPGGGQAMAAAAVNGEEQVEGEEEGGGEEEEDDDKGPHEIKVLAKKNRERFAIKKSYSIEVHEMNGPENS